MTIQALEEQAKSLAKDNREADPSITRIFWFPDPEGNEVWLVEAMPTVPSSGKQVHPFYFRASPSDGLPAPSGIALIRPEEIGKLDLPKKWGKWENAKELGNGE